MNNFVETREFLTYAHKVKNYELMPAPVLITQDNPVFAERRFLVAWPTKMYTVQMLIEEKRFVTAIVALILAR